MFTEWLLEVQEDVQFEQKEKEELCNLLKRFYAEVRTQDGKEYAKKSLLCVRACVQRYLSQPPFNIVYNIIGDPVFSSANNVLIGHIKKKKEAWLDHSASYPPITEADKKKMYCSRVLSHDTPETLQNQVYYEVCLHFGRRAREGLHALKQSDILMRQDDEGIEYATLSFNPTEKNHQGLSQGNSAHSQRMYGTGTESCPLKTLKLYLDKLTPSNPSFFQTPKKKYFRLSSTWYTRSPVGINTIGKFMQKISADANSLKCTVTTVSELLVSILSERRVSLQEISEQLLVTKVSKVLNIIQKPLIKSESK